MKKYISGSLLTLSVFLFNQACTLHKEATTPRNPPKIQNGDDDKVSLPKKDSGKQPQLPGNGEDEKTDRSLEKVDDSREMSFKILDDEFKIKIESVELVSSENSKTITTKLTINNELVEAVAKHDQYTPTTGFEIVAGKMPYNIHFTSFCDTADCKKYLWSAILLKKDQGGNSEAFRDFALIADLSSSNAKASEIIVALNKAYPHDLSSKAVLDLLREAMAKKELENSSKGEE